MKQTYHRSKRKTIAMIILLSVALLILDRYGADYGLKKKLLDQLNPFFTYTHQVVQGMKKNLFFLLNFRRLGMENELHSKKIQELEQKLLETDEIRSENDRLNELLNFKSQLKFRVVPAKIIGHDSSNWKKSVIINKGLDDGVLPHHAVICPKGIVGKVVESYQNSAKVMLLIDNESQVGGMILRTRDIGVLQGQDKDDCLLNYLSRNADVKKGDLVITSGFDGFFPKGIILGEVDEVFSEDFGLYRYARIIPTVDFSKLEEVLIIKTHLSPKNDG